MVPVTSWPTAVARSKVDATPKINFGHLMPVKRATSTFHLANNVSDTAASVVRLLRLLG